MRELNRNLRRLSDGAVIAGIELSHHNGIRRHIATGRVYWPFVVFQCSRRDWNLSHAPSGFFVASTPTLKKAVEVIGVLRQSADWNFVSGSGRKSQAAQTASAAAMKKALGL